ncbi:hypothetical protein [Pseudoxanthomonas suwonensis]
MHIPGCASLIRATRLGNLPGSGEPYAADRPGTRPDRRDGTVLAWKLVERP